MRSLFAASHLPSLVGSIPPYGPPGATAIRPSLRSLLSSARLTSSAVVKAPSSLLVCGQAAKMAYRCRKEGSSARAVRMVWQGSAQPHQTSADSKLRSCQGVAGGWGFQTEAGTHDAKGCGDIASTVAHDGAQRIAIKLLVLGLLKTAIETRDKAAPGEVVDDG